MNRTVNVAWRAFSDRPMIGYDLDANVTFEVETDLTDLALCEQIFKETNLYEGPIWDLMQPLPEDRTHTALSVIFDKGDLVTIDGITYEVADMGFRKVTA